MSEPVEAALLASDDRQGHEDIERAVCARRGGQIMRYGDGFWFGSALGGRYTCSGGPIHSPVAHACPTAPRPDDHGCHLNDRTPFTGPHSCWHCHDDPPRRHVCPCCGVVGGPRG